MAWLIFSALTWARYAELFAYDKQSENLQPRKPSLKNQLTPGAG
jgi:hypothetical protein